MRFFKSLLVATSLLLTLITSAEVPSFEEGDRVVFIGDSITHGGTYHSNLYLFYATRFPESKWVGYNCGISGDTAPGTNKRFGTDIAMHSPNKATIMLGMNDAWAWCFQGEETEKKIQGREDSYQTYIKEMDTLAKSLKDLGCDLILIKPSIYDQTAELEGENLIGKNDHLGRFGQFIDTLAERYDATIVDFYSIMNEINSDIQDKDPSATIISSDRVHPGAPGHLLMTYEFLKSQKMPKYVSAIEIDAATTRFTQLQNCSIEEGAKFSPIAIEFDCTEKSLPFPVSKDQYRSLDWVPFQEEFNQQIIKVTNLETGAYQLKIDDVSIGTYAASELNDGINLSSTLRTPQYKQALKVKAINDSRVDVAKRLRAIALVRYTMIAKLDPLVPEEDQDTLKKALNAHVEESKGKSWYGYLKEQVKTYSESVADEDILKLQVEEQMDEIWTLNIPKTHKWTISKIVR